MVRLHYTPGSKLGLMLDISARSPKTELLLRPASLSSWTLHRTNKAATRLKLHEAKSTIREHVSCPGNT